jgi:hypothetical protein
MVAPSAPRTMAAARTGSTFSISIVGLASRQIWCSSTAASIKLPFRKLNSILCEQAGRGGLEPHETVTNNVLALPPANKLAACRLGPSSRGSATLKCVEWKRWCPDLRRGAMLGSVKTCKTSAPDRKGPDQGAPTRRPCGPPCKLVPLSNLVDVQMGRLRRKVDAPHEPRMIYNEDGTGFILRSPAGFRSRNRVQTLDGAHHRRCQVLYRLNRYPTSGIGLRLRTLF